MDSPDPGSGLPMWVVNAPFPLWVCDPTGSLVFVNEKASELLGDGSPLEGRPCHEGIGATGEAGEELCGVRCRLRRSALAGERPPPVLMRTRGEGRWALVVPIVLDGERPQDARIVHCAQDLDPLVRAAAYVKRVAERSGTLASPAARLAELTAREREVLALLGRDEDPHAIARSLHVSLVTVRNHVQHALAKLGAHSIQEAVALWLLQGEPPPALPAGRDPFRVGPRPCAAK